MSAGPFSPRALAWIIGLGAGSIAIGVALSIFSRDLFGVLSAGADGYSRSAVGHRALVETLEGLGVPVVLSRQEAAGAMDAADLIDAGLVVIAPPLGADDQERRLRRLVEAAPRVLLALPRWEVVPDRERPGWISAAAPLDRRDVEKILAAVEPDADLHVVRTASPGQWRWPEDELPGPPALSEPQLVRAGSPRHDGVATGLEPIVECDGGVLLGRLRRSPHVIVLADPDLLSNHGLGRGENALLALSLLERHVRRDGGPLIFDQTVHGHVGEKSVWRRAFDFPFVLATVQVALALALLAWAGMGRFGAPRAVAEHLEAGKGLLIDNTAHLLQFGGHSGPALRRLLSSALQEVAERLHAPPGLDHDQVSEWVRSVSRARGAAIDLAALEAEIDTLAAQRRSGEGPVLALARRLHDWKRELLDVAGRSPHRR